MSLKNLIGISLEAIEPDRATIARLLAVTDCLAVRRASLAYKQGPSEAPRSVVETTRGVIATIGMNRDNFRVYRKERRRCLRG